MVERSIKKPSAIPISPSGPAPTVDISADSKRVSASLPTGDSVEVLLHGATVVSWKSGGRERLFLSDKAVLDGSKAVRGGIPLVFPLFGPAQPSHSATAKLPQHGFARTSRWEYLGRSSSESTSLPGTGGADGSVTLDFGLSEAMLSESARGAWPSAFGLTYRVTLAAGELTTSLQVQNTGDKAFEFQALLHTYLGLGEQHTIEGVAVKGLEDVAFLDKVTAGGPKKTDAAKALVTISGETDRVYEGVPADAVVSVVAADKPIFDLRREGLADIVVWNPWEDKAKGMADFGPADGWKRMLCVEAGQVAAWTKVEGGETWEGRQTIKAYD